MGAYLGAVSPIMSTMNIVKNAMSVYRTPLIEVSTKCMFTNTMMVSAYRGAGRPEGNYYMERLIDAAAKEMGIDRLSLRRRNHVRPSEMPYAAASGMKYDSGEFTKVLDRAVELADWNGFKARKREAKKPRQAARHRRRQLSRGHRAAQQRDGRHPLRAGWQCDDYHRHPRLRPGPCLAVRPGTEREARDSVRAHPPASGRQRRARRRRRHRRLALHVRERHGNRRSGRQGD